MSDILRDIAELLDQEDKPTDSLQQQTGLTPVGDVQGGDTDTTTMVPPLQAKLEILKKSEGLPNVYDSNKEPDELAMLKHRAGLTSCQIEASEDNDILG